MSDDRRTIDCLPSTLVLTFDNLGEASQLERGTWPAGEPLGRDPSVHVALPRLLDELDANQLTATFFVEAINCELYPEALLEIARRGHELGHHGWRHESWGQLSAQRERGALTSGMHAFRSLGVDVGGFRPPGGSLLESSAALMRETGISWCSPAGGPTEVRDRLAYVPFEWELVDAYHLMPRFADLRVRNGDRAKALEPGRLADQFTGELNALTAHGGQRTLILHPFLTLEDAWLAGVQQLLALIGDLALQHRLSVVPGGRFADWLRSPGTPRQG
jgi:peptidoglycan/xylan/chitin deacetylase (PgdA/CDA1 family)